MSAPSILFLLPQEYDFKKGVKEMSCRITDLRHKDVVNIKDGCVLGCVSDVEIDTCNACVVAIIVYGRLRCFGLLGREDDIVIGWNKIQVIGDDIILVNFDMPRRRPRKVGSMIEGLFNR